MAQHGAGTTTSWLVLIPAHSSCLTTKLTTTAFRFILSSARLGPDKADRPRGHKQEEISLGPLTVFLWRSLCEVIFNTKQWGPDCTKAPATGTAPCYSEMCAILSRLGKLKDLSQIDGVVPVFGLLLTTPLIISQNQPLH